MRLIIAGSRSVSSPRALAAALAQAQASGLAVSSVSSVLSGGAAGADQLGEAWAAQAGVPVRRIQADWSRLGRGAGAARNAAMAAEADALLLLWDGASPGSAHMLSVARARGLAVFAYLVSGSSVSPLPAPAAAPAQLPLF